MIDRINKNEERLNNILSNIKELEEVLNIFKNNQKDISKLSKYYGSKNWFKDKEAYENNSIPQVKAGVLSEDSIWNMLEDIDNIINEMQDIINKYYNNRR
ncbi:MAG: DUF4298 domain-containing protein [Bacilli bacterium]|nr:DUF4298 domain-containing protein [Bacilli bacterium]